MYTYGITGTSIGEFRDVTLATVADGQILRYNATTGQWQNATIEEITTVLDSLSDVSIPSPTAGCILAYNDATGQWENTEIVEGLGIDTTYTNLPANYQGLYDNGASYAIGDVVSTDGDPYGVDGNYYIRTTNPGNPGYPPAVGGGNNAEWDEYPFSVNIEIALDATLDDLSDVTAPTPTSGDFLKWNGTAWVNDTIDLSTDTTGNYVADVTAGTGISVTHTPSAGSTATVALNATMDNLSDTSVNSTLEWPGPFTNFTTGSGAPSNGTGSVGDFYIDTVTSSTLTLYGPKAASGTIWPNQGTVLSGAVGLGITFDPVGNAHNAGASGYFIRTSFTPPFTLTPVSVWGPYSAGGIGDRSSVSYDQATRTFKDVANRYVSAIDGGNWAAVSANVTGNYSVNTWTGSMFFLTLTGNATLYSGPNNFIRPRLTSGTRGATITIALKQGGLGGYTATWPTTVVWAGGSAPVLSSRVDDVDVFQFTTTDNGSTWYGSQLTSGASRNNISLVSSKTADYTFTRADIGNVVVLDSASTGYTFTIPTNASVPLPNGATITVATVNDGDLAIAGASGVTVNGATCLSTKGEFVQLVKTGTDTWLVSTPQYRPEQISTKTADYTFTATDRGNTVLLDSTTNHTFTIPTNANVPYPIGTKITVATVSSGNITVAGDTGVTVSGFTNLNTAGVIATLLKVGTDAWLCHH